MILLLPNDISERLTRQDGRVFLVADAQRVGAFSFFAAIEWYWYPPDTERTRFFDVFATEWTEMRWAVAAFPRPRLPAAKTLARKLGLRIANGVPTLVEHRNGRMEATFFPGAKLPSGLDNMAVFTVENDGRESPVYRNRGRDNDEMRQADVEICALFNRGKRFTPAQIADYIYGPGFPAGR